MFIVLADKLAQIRVLQYSPLYFLSFYTVNIAESQLAAISCFYQLSTIYCSMSHCLLHPYNSITTRVTLCSCAKGCVAICATLLLIPLLVVFVSAVIGGSSVICSFCNALNIAMLENSVVGCSGILYSW